MIGGGATSPEPKPPFLCAMELKGGPAAVRCKETQCPSCRIWYPQEVKDEAASE